MRLEHDPTIREVYMPAACSPSFDTVRAPTQDQLFTGRKLHLDACSRRVTRPNLREHYRTRSAAGSRTGSVRLEVGRSWPYRAVAALG
jgi:hypothetical protein